MGLLAFLSVALEFSFGAVVFWKLVHTQKSDSAPAESEDSPFSLHPLPGVSSDDFRTQLFFP